MRNFFSMDHQDQLTYVDHTVSGSLRDLRVFGFDISTDEFFIMESSDQLYILDFLATRACALAVRVFEHLPYAVAAREARLEEARENAIAALIGNHPGDNYLRPAIYREADRVRDLTHRNLLLEHQNLEDFALHITP